MSSSSSISIVIVGICFSTPQYVPNDPGVGYPISDEVGYPIKSEIFCAKLSAGPS